VVAWPEASRAYFHFARTVLPDLPNWQEFPIWHLHTVRGFWRLLVPEWPLLGDVLTLLLTGLGLVEGYRFWRRHRDRSPLTFAAAVALTLWITPHAMIYDWAVLLIPAVLLWEEVPEGRGRWRALYALVWLATFLGDPLTYGQWRWFHRAVQVTVPVLGFVLYRVGQGVGRRAG
jgi:alpha-1,2-mannosyltransferase